MVVHLSEDLEKLVQEKVSSGLYRSPDEVVSRALHVLDEQDQLEDRAKSVPAAQSSYKWPDLSVAGQGPEPGIEEGDWVRLRDLAYQGRGA
jgi:putative addiction module CopG family antidote